MKKVIYICLFLIGNTIFSQTTTIVTLSNGDGWYRIIEGGGNKSGLIRISGTSGNNRSTDIAMYVSMMAYDQGGSINIINNKFYNQNHIDEIRAGTNKGKYILDVHFVGINNPVNASITVDSGIPVLSTPIFNPSSTITGKIEISGRVLGMSSTRWPIYFSNNVGIGTTDPSYAKLQIRGGATHQLFAANRPDSNVPALYLGNDGTNNAAIASNNSDLTFGKDLSGNYTEYMRIKSTGNVGIGITNPDAKLTVKGNIHTNEVKVDLLGAVVPDYVFYKDYDLKTLTEVETFINTKGHLPNIPSAKELETNGLHLKDMNLKLLEKIEELTLYTIQQEKELQTQKVINKKVEEKFKTQEIRLQKIEALLKSIKQ